MQDLHIIISLLSTVLLILPVCYFLFYIKFKSDDKVEVETSNNISKTRATKIYFQELPVEADDLSDTDPESEEEQKGLLGQIKQSKLKNLHKQLTEDQKREERLAEAKQIEQIYRLLQQQQNDLTPEDVEDQLNLYR